ncbi:hypothetical protein ACIRYZ_26840 [Kitasatospora sp. NPDC101155]|uniref:hypothetical protein n=1 Tax=Kitasatospora sp. NPDC101155 TaxID=3364097 RepID=UPI0037FFBFE5
MVLGGEAEHGLHHREGVQVRQASQPTSRLPRRVTGVRTGFTTLWANPDGTLTSDRSTGPIRMKVGEAWVPVDTTPVQTPDGKDAPKAHPRGVSWRGGATRYDGTPASHLAFTAQ